MNFEHELTKTLKPKKMKTSNRNLVVKAFCLAALIGLLFSCSSEEDAIPGKEILFGMTSAGGANGNGVIFSVNTDSTGIKVEHNFTGEDGDIPIGRLAMGSNGKLYGMTQSGGVNNAGVIFEYDQNTHTYTKKIDFTNTTGEAMGSGWKYKLTLVNKKFYGITEFGGLNGAGVLFEYDPATNIYKNKFNFIDESGSRPHGFLTVANGKLYGTTFTGGLNTGTLFEYDPATSTYTKKFDFGGDNGTFPHSGLTVVKSKLYGTTLDEGVNDLGVLFAYDLATNTYTKKLDFTGTTGVVIGSHGTWGSLTLVNGKLYGLSVVGGANNMGVLFEYNPANNAYSKKLDFTGDTGLVKGSSPEGGLTLSRNGKLYGMTVGGGFFAQGVLFEYDPATGSYVIMHDFTNNTGRNPSTELVSVIVK